MDEEKRKTLEKVKVNIRSIVMSDPKVMDLNKLMRDYRETIGTSIPAHTFGYTNVLTFLQKECVDVIRFSGNQYNPVLTPIVTESVKHVNEMINRQKSSGYSRAPRRGFGIVQKTSQQNNNHSNSNCNNGRNGNNSNNNGSSNNSYSNGRSITNNNNNSYNNTRPITNNSNNRTFQQSSNNYNKTRSSPTKKPTHNSNTPVKQDSPARNGNTGNENPFKFITRTNGEGRVPIRLDQLPNRGGESSASSTITKSSSSNSQKSSDVIADVDSDGLPSNHKLSKKLLENLKALIEEHPNGMWCHELCPSYKNKYGCELRVMQLGYNATAGMCRALPMIFKMSRPKSRGDCRLFPLSAIIPPEYQDGAQDAKKEPVQEKPPDSIDDMIFGSQALPGVKCDPSLYPEDCAMYGEALAWPLPVADVLLLQLTQVRDPSHFWFQVISKSASASLDTIMDEMTDFYYNSAESSNYTMVRAAAKTGQLCAVPYIEGGRYHRAIIIKNISWEIVKVLFVDYGTVSDVEFGKVRMLLNKWCDFAIQAHRGRLGGAGPKGGRWGPKGVERFMELIRERTLQGTVLHRMQADNNDIVTLDLMDHYEETNIAKTLISEGFAVPDTKHDTQKEFHISFDALENGIDEPLVDEDETLEPDASQTQPTPECNTVEGVEESTDLQDNDKEDADDMSICSDIENVLNLSDKITDTKDTETLLTNEVDKNQSPFAYQQQFCQQLNMNVPFHHQFNYPYTPDSVHAMNQMFAQMQQPYMPVSTQMNMSMHPQMNMPIPSQMNMPIHPQMNMPIPPQMNLSMHPQMNMPRNFPSPFYNNMPVQNHPQFMPMQFNYNRYPVMPFVRPRLESNNLIRPKRSSLPINLLDNPLCMDALKLDLNKVKEDGDKNNENSINNNKNANMLDKNNVNDDKNVIDKENNANNSEKNIINNEINGASDKYSADNYRNDLNNDRTAKDKNIINKDKNYVNNDRNVSKDQVNAKDCDIREEVSNNLKAINIELFKDLGNTECKLVNQSIESIESEERRSLEEPDCLEVLSDEECENEPSVKPSSSIINMDDYDMKLVDLSEMLDGVVEIWNVKYKLFVMLQQVARIFLKDSNPEHVCKQFERSAKYNVILCTLIQDNGTVVTDMLSNIRLTGRSGAKMNQVITLTNNKIIDMDQPYMILVPLERILEVLCSDIKNLSCSVLELMQCAIKLYVEHATPGSEPSCSSSGNEGL